MIREEMKIDPERETKRIVSFIRSELEGAGLPNVVIGLSGGLDSSVVALLCARAAGRKNVFGFILPYRTSSADALAHAKAVADGAGISCETVDISPAVDTLQGMLSTNDRIRLGNVMARARMIVLYDRSALRGALVAGTGNRTEAMLGY